MESLAEECNKEFVAEVFDVIVFVKTSPIWLDIVKYFVFADL